MELNGLKKKVRWTTKSGKKWIKYKLFAKG